MGISLLALVSGCVPPAPMTIRSDFVPTRGVTPMGRGSRAQGCALFVNSLSDDRREPAILGNVAGRAIRAPEDSDAWLHTILQQLQTRGVRVVFGDPPKDSAGSLAASVHFKSAWVSNIETSKTGTAVMQIMYVSHDGSTWDRSYRGSQTAMNWASGAGEMQSLFERVLNQVLDQIGADVRSVCPNVRD